MRLDAHDVEALALVDQPPCPRERVLAGVDDRPDLEALEPGLLLQLPAERILVRLAGIDPSPDGRPPGIAADRMLEPDEQDAALGVENERTHGLPLVRVDAAPAARETNAAVRRMAPRRSRATWTAERRAPSSRSLLSCGPSSGRSLKSPR